MPRPHLARINYYPVKSLDGQAIARTRILPSGALEHDRQFAIYDAGGELINGKRLPAVQRLTCRFDPETRNLELEPRNEETRGALLGQRTAFHIDRDRAQLERWLGEFFELPAPVAIRENATAGFPDDTNSPGPTVISQATLEAVAGWFAGLSVDEVRKRFRPNLEIGGVPAFYEDRLFAAEPQQIKFAVGPAVLAGAYPCPRCAVPTRWSMTGQPGPDHAFGKTFAERRKTTLPDWADPSRFEHFYCLAINTRLLSGGGSTLQVGDEVAVAE